MRDQDNVVLSFQGGIWDGGELKLPTIQADIGYRIEWAIRSQPLGKMHMYESELPVLEDSTELTMVYAGLQDDMDVGYRPGSFDLDEASFMDGEQDLTDAD